METKIVPFYGDQLQAVKDDRGVWVALDEPCASIGIDYSSQLAKLRRKSWAKMAMITISQGIQPRVCLAVRSVPMWLATIDAYRVRADLRDKLVRYQDEAADVLARAFLGEPAPLGLTDVAALVDARLDRFERGFVYNGVSLLLRDQQATTTRLDHLEKVTDAILEEVTKVRRRQAASGRGSSGLSRRDRRRRRAAPVTALAPVPSQPTLPSVKP